MTKPHISIFCKCPSLFFLQKLCTSSPSYSINRQVSAGQVPILQSLPHCASTYLLLHEDKHLKAKNPRIATFESHHAHRLFVLFYSERQTAHKEKPKGNCYNECNPMPCYFTVESLTNRFIYFVIYLTIK